MIVLDTNVMSELVRDQPAEAVKRWVRKQPSALLFTTAISEAEILYGVALLPLGRRRTVLGQAVAAIFDDELAGRVLPFDSVAARIYADILADRRRRGRPVGQSDAQIAAIAASHGASVATRNTADFIDCGIAVVNPWED
jgi:predicted nucleic acid-binding protein